MDMELQRFSDRYYLPLFITLNCRSVISKLTGGESVVKRVSFGNYEVYNDNSTIPSVVSLGDKKTFPACTCDEWNNNALPCLHMFQVFKKCGLSFNDLSSLYRSSPCFKADNSLMKLSHTLQMGQKSNPSLSSKRVSGSKPRKSKSTRTQHSAQTKNSKTIDFKSLKCKVVFVDTKNDQSKNLVSKQKDASTQCSIDLFTENGKLKKLVVKQKDASTQYSIDLFTENEKLKNLTAKQRDASTQCNIVLSTESVELKNPTAKSLFTDNTSNQYPKKIDTKSFKDASTQYQIFMSGKELDFGRSQPTSFLKNQFSVLYKDKSEVLSQKQLKISQDEFVDKAIKHLFLKYKQDGYSRLTGEKMKEIVQEVIAQLVEKEPSGQHFLMTVPLLNQKNAIPMTNKDKAMRPLLHVHVSPVKSPRTSPLKALGKNSKQLSKISTKTISNQTKPRKSINTTLAYHENDKVHRHLSSNEFSRVNVPQHDKVPQKGSPVRLSSQKQARKGNKETDVVNTTSSSARDGVSKRKRKTKVKQNQSNSKRLKKLVKLDKPSNSESAVPTYQYQAFVEPQAMLPASVDNPNETAVLSLHSEIKIEPDDLFDIEIDIDESVLSKEYLESNVEANSVEESLAKISMLKEQLDLSLQNETFSDFAS